MKHLDVVWTNQFKKDYKLAMKRHLDIDLLMMLSGNWQWVRNFQIRTETMY